MKNKKIISEIMTKEVQNIDAATSVQVAEQLFKEKKIRHLPVVSKGKLVGMLSLTDILRMSFGDTYGTAQYDIDNTVFDMLNVGQIMKANPTTVATTSNIKEVAELLTKEEFHALPVVNQKNSLVGIVTTTDIIEYLLQFNIE